MDGGEKFGLTAAVDAAGIGEPPTVDDEQADMFEPEPDFALPPRAVLRDAGGRPGRPGRPGRRKGAKNRRTED